MGLATLAASALNEYWRAARPVLWFGATAAVLGPLALLYRDYRGILETAAVWNQDPAVLLAWGSESWNPDPPWAAASQENALISSWRSWAGMRAAVVTKSGALELAAGTVPAAAAGVAAGALSTRHKTHSTLVFTTARTAAWAALGALSAACAVLLGSSAGWTGLGARLAEPLSHAAGVLTAFAVIGAAAGVPAAFRHPPPPGIRAGGLKVWDRRAENMDRRAGGGNHAAGNRCAGQPGRRLGSLENDPADADPALLQRALAAYLLGIGALFLVPDAATTPNWPGDPLYGHGVATVTAMIAAGAWRRSAWPGRCRVETRRTWDNPLSNRTDPRLGLRSLWHRDRECRRFRESRHRSPSPAAA